jgi:hypothetical protein
MAKCRIALQIFASAERRKAIAVAPAPAPVSEPMDWHALGEMIGAEIGHAEAEARRYCDQNIAEVRAEIEVLKAEIKVRGEVEALREELAALRAERGKALRVV